MNLPRVFILGAALSLASVLPATAQGECRIRGVALQPGVPETIQVKEAGAPIAAGEIEVKSFLNHEFETLKFTGKQLEFAAAADPAAVLGRCEIPAKASSLILLFIPDGPNQAAFKVLAVEDSAKAFPAGSFKVANLGPDPVKIELESKPFEFKPGEIRAIEDPPVSANQSSGMRAFFQRDGKWQSFASGVWPHPGGKRVLQVITLNPATRQIEMKGLRDVAKP